MDYLEFRVNDEFYTATGKWRCTDIGRRTIVAIRLSKSDDPSWYKGPPYAVLEYVFDENDMEGCEHTVEAYEKNYGEKPWEGDIPIVEVFKT